MLLPENDKINNYYYSLIDAKVLTKEDITLHLKKQGIHLTRDNSCITSDDINIWDGIMEKESEFQEIYKNARYNSGQNYIEYKFPVDKIENQGYELFHKVRLINREDESTKLTISLIYTDNTLTDEVIFSGDVGRNYLFELRIICTLQDNTHVVKYINKLPGFGDIGLKGGIDKIKFEYTNKGISPAIALHWTYLRMKATLSTFYNASGWAGCCYEEQPFDYVIMDEASQALLGMIAACKNLGKKVLWIGDQKQMQPIILLSDETIIRNDYYMLANGFQTLCDNFRYPSFILTETRRLLPRAAALTSTFYHVPIKSVAEFEYIFKDDKKDYIPSDGGSTIVFKAMPAGKKDDFNSCQFVAGIVEDIMQKDRNLQVAVLTKFTDSVKMLQNCVIDRVGTRENILIDTVERVQGLTCDVCIFYIPNTMMAMSLDRPLFNVATSRAKQLTIIVCDPSLKNENCDNDVRKYLDAVMGQASSVSLEEAPAEEHGEPEIADAPGLKVLGKIDLSQFETPKQKSVKSQVKKNIYIIDTNVFVKYPDILTKIDASYQVVLSAKVIDELDKLKITLDPEGKRNVEKALRNINRAMDNPNVSMELSDPTLLPDDFNKRSPDNNILTVALKFKSENPILLTSDNGLQIKAKGLKIATISLKEFLQH